MEKRISFTQFQSVKTVAKACDPLFRESERLKEQIAKLAEKYKACLTQISALEAGVVQIVGFHVNDLVVRVKDDKGTKYIPTDIVKYDEHTKEFVITPPEDTEVTGSDFDIDAEEAEAEREAEQEEEKVEEEEGSTDEDELPFGESPSENEEIF